MLRPFSGRTWGKHGRRGGSRDAAQAFALSQRLSWQQGERHPPWPVCARPDRHVRRRRARSVRAPAGGGRQRYLRLGLRPGRNPPRGRYAGAAQAFGVSREVLGHDFVRRTLCWGRATPVARSSLEQPKTRDWSRAPPAMKPLSETLPQIARKPGRWTVAGLPEGADSLALAELARATGGQDILHVARDGQRLERLQDGLRFFAPERAVLVFPAWDCLPYDRLSPHPDIVAERLETLARLAAPKKAGAPARIVLASAGAALQRVPPRSLYAEAAVVLRKGQTLDVAWLTKFLGENGYGRSETVMEPGEFAVRGGLVDLFPPGTSEPLRLDLFGDSLEAIRSFDAMSQRSTGTRDEVVLLPVSEVLLTKDSIARFRGGYRELFGNVAGDDILYEAVSAGQRHVGMEHWLPLFHDHLETLLDYCPEAIVTADHQIAEAFTARHELITDYYDARRKTGGKGGMSGGADYKPVPPERLYLKPSEWDRLLAGHAVT